MQVSNIIIMPNRPHNPDPEGLSTVWREIHKQGKDIKDLQDTPKRPSVWSWFWKERSWTIACSITVAGAVGAGTWYLSGMILDRHIQLALNPVQTELKRIDGDVREIRGMLRLLTTKAVTQQLSSIPPRELKNHQDELKEVKNNLAALSKDTPGYWAVSFQAISLYSMAVAYIHNPHPSESTVKDSSGISVEKNGDVVVLKGLITNSRFKDSVIRFDPNVRLMNVIFVHCVFIFPIQEVPPKPLQSIADTLLRADLSRPVTISS